MASYVAHGPHPRRLHRRTARPDGYRRGGGRARAAEAPGQGILGLLPVPRRALALVHGVADQAVLPLLRLRRARHRAVVPDELRPPRVPRCGGRTCPPQRHGSAARDAAAQREQRYPRPVQRPGSRCALLPAQPGGQREGQGLSRWPRRGCGDPHAVHDRLCAGRLLGAEGRAGHRRAADEAARPRRPVLEERPRPRLRQVPRPGDVSLSTTGVAA